MKKILQISNYYYPNIGGIEQVAKDISAALSNNKKYEVKVICFNENSSDGDYVCRRRDTVHEKIEGTEVTKCGCLAKLSSQSLSLVFGSELNKLMKNYDPDIVIFHYPNPFQAFYLMKYRKYKFKLVIYWHLDITKQKILKHLFHRQDLKLIERSSKILGATPKHVETSEYTWAFGEKKEVLPYMIDTEKLILSSEEERKASEIREKYKNKVIGFFVGRHVPYKGLTYLVEAAKKTSDDIIILIAGSGELTEALKEQAGGAENIVFLGRITDSEKRVYYRACDIICFPSVTRNEGFGLALAEGMYFGKPAVTFKIEGSGVNYVNLADVTGIECRNSDSFEYAEALNKLAADETLRMRMGEAAKKRVEDHFIPEKFKENLTALIEEL